MKEFYEIMQRYETITIDEINETLEHESKIYVSAIKKKLTGFGSPSTCKLCIKYLNRQESVCTNCTWVQLTGCECNEGVNSQTYMYIEYAHDQDALIYAYRARAKYMRKVIETAKRIGLRIKGL
jgi:hypothetical protein